MGAPNLSDPEKFAKDRHISLLARGAFTHCKTDDLVSMVPQSGMTGKAYASSWAREEARRQNSEPDAPGLTDVTEGLVPGNVVTIEVSNGKVYYIFRRSTEKNAYHRQECTMCRFDNSKAYTFIFYTGIVTDQEQARRKDYNKHKIWKGVRLLGIEHAFDEKEPTAQRKLVRWSSDVNFETSRAKRP